MALTGLAVPVTMISRGSSVTPSPDRSDRVSGSQVGAGVAVSSSSGSVITWARHWESPRPGLGPGRVSIDPSLWPLYSPLPWSHTGHQPSHSVNYSPLSFPFRWCRAWHLLSLSHIVNIYLSTDFPVTYLFIKSLSNHGFVDATFAEDSSGMKQFCTTK